MQAVERPLRISIAGPGEASPAEAALAEETGRLVGRKGWILVCGGLGGVMEAACRGAASSGAITVGLLPGSDPDSANPHVLVPIPTGLGEARNTLVAGACDALIAIGGRLGTLSEIALALRRGVPVVGLETWRLDPALVQPFVFHRALSPAEAVELAGRLARR